MRYLIQLLVPALIVIGVIFVVMRSRHSGAERTDADTSTHSKSNVQADGDKGMIIAIIVIGAVVAVAVVFAMQGVWGGGP